MLRFSDELDLELDKVRKEINIIADQLEELYKLMKIEEKNKGKYAKFTPSYLSLERERNALRKELIDLDLQHKEIHFKIINSNKNQIIYKREIQKEHYEKQEKEILEMNAENHSKEEQSHSEKQQIERNSKELLHENQEKLNLSETNKNCNIEKPENVRFYENSEIALDVSRTEHEKSKEFFHHNREFSFSNVNRIESIEMTENQNEIRKFEERKYPKQNLFHQQEKLSLFKEQEKMKTYEMEARLDFQREKLEKRLKDLNSYNYFKAREYETLESRRVPNHYYRFIGFKPFYYPIRYY